MYFAFFLTKSLPTLASLEAKVSRAAAFSSDLLRSSSRTSSDIVGVGLASASIDVRRRRGWNSTRECRNPMQAGCGTSEEDMVLEKMGNSSVRFILNG